MWIKTISLLLFLPYNCFGLPRGFIYLKDLDPTIEQDIRYCSSYNFVGRVINGYIRPQCILSLEAAEALHNIQKELKPFHLSLKVYDCYRPVRAVKDFVLWSKDPKQQCMKQFFYPHVPKSRLFELGYIAQQSTHSRGSTVDLTLVNYTHKPRMEILKNKILNFGKKPLTIYNKSDMWMGTTFDFMDINSHTFSHHSISKIAYRNRILLRTIMKKHGFEPYNKEWWHFTFKKEPFKDHYFDFVVD